MLDRYRTHELIAIQLQFFLVVTKENFKSVNIEIQNVAGSDTLLVKSHQY